MSGQTGAVPDADGAVGAAWEALSAHREAVGSFVLEKAFEQDPGRAARMSLEACGILLDASKQRVSDQTLALLADLARASGLSGRIEAMFAGAHVNATEDRAALHVALRAPVGETLMADGTDVMPGVRVMRDRMFDLARQVREGRWRGHTGRAITDVVNLGIGGSALGPRMACEALRHLAADGPAVHFVSTVDGSELARLLARLQPETTLFIVASKSFGTQETMSNARSARAWLLASGAPESAVERHFIAVSSRADAVRAFGIDPDGMLGFEDWVGGRYSLWSAIGLPVAMAVGPEAFEQLLAGAHAMDRHFRTTPFEANLPVRLALLGVWNADCLGAATQAVAPYNACLALLPAHLQQLEMESNGKSVRIDGRPVGHATSPVVWGNSGIDAQHAWFQMLHQGTQIVPVDFIVAIDSQDGLPGHQSLLLANCLAQAEALMRGRSAEAVRTEMAATGLTGAALDQAVAHRVFPGNRPSTMLMLDRVDPFTLGALVALYEHKVFAQSVIWGINPFDQWGVELGKALAGRILPQLEGGPSQPGQHDASTAALIERVRRRRG
jgi:glucose-6-phosphate isomerase